MVQMGIHEGGEGIPLLIAHAFSLSDVRDPLEASAPAPEESSK